MISSPNRRSLPKRIAVPLAIVLALTLSSSLSGCIGGNPIKNIVKQATGGDVDLGGASLPDNFPKDDVPLVDGSIAYGAYVKNGDGTIWNVTINAAQNPYSDAKSKLTGAGFAVQTEQKGTGGDAVTSLFTKDPYTVGVVVTKSGADKYIVNYTVTKTTSSK